MSNALDKFTFSRFTFELRAKETLSLPPYKGSTLRGAFGHAFKSVVCIKRDRECSTCLVRGTCVYMYVFETPLPGGASLMTKYTHAPHPFVLCPPLGEKTAYSPGESLSFGLTLIGKALPYLPYFIYAFERMGERGLGKDRGAFSFSRVLNGHGVLYDEDTKILKYSPPLTLGDILPHASTIVQGIRLTFLTPTRLKYIEKLTGEPEFHIIIRNLLRRLSILSYFHCGEEFAIDFKALIRRAEGVKMTEHDFQWVDWERYSSRQGIRMKMGGFMGTVTYEGDLTEFLPFLTLGQYVHVGKGTSFGLGHYQLKRREEQ